MLWHAAAMHLGLLAGAAFYTGVGTAALLRPALVPRIFGGSAPTASARTEIRAVYGGLPLAMAGFVVAESRSAATGSPRTDAVAALSAAMAIGRVIGSVAEGEADAVTRLFIALEAATAAALVVGVRSGGRPTARG
ncbi:MAG: hypothetical protein JWN84_4544 [Nocardioides sp.]|nr:hypothetical protein [Nocardioides sp.]